MLNPEESNDSPASAADAGWNAARAARSLPSQGALLPRAGSDGVTRVETSGGGAEDRSGAEADAVLALAGDAFTLAPAACLVGADAVGLHRALRRIEAALCEGLPVESVLGVRYRRSVSFVLQGLGEPIPAQAAKFGFRLRLPRSGELATVVFDRAASEALAQVFMAFYAPLRGYGDPTRVETALLEFATTLTVTELRREGAPSAGEADLVGFLEKGELASVEPPSGAILSFRVVVDQREGRATLHLPNAKSSLPPRVFPPAKRVETRAEKRSTVEVRLALPPIELGAEEWKDAALGDVLLLGATEFSSLASPCALVTDTGWRISTASIVADSPTLVSVAVGVFDPDAYTGGSASGNVVHIDPTIGAARVTLDQIAHWTSGARIDLPKAGALPVSLFHGGVELARGELVRAEGELGIRLGAIYRKEVAS